MRRITPLIEYQEKNIDMIAQRQSNNTKLTDTDYPERTRTTKLTRQSRRKETQLLEANRSNFFRK